MIEKNKFRYIFQANAYGTAHIFHNYRMCAMRQCTEWKKEPEHECLRRLFAIVGIPKEGVLF